MDQLSQEIYNFYVVFVYLNPLLFCKLAYNVGQLSYKHFQHSATLVFKTKLHVYTFICVFILDYVVDIYGRNTVKTKYLF
jgi:hypothetical protein